MSQIKTASFWIQFTILQLSTSRQPIDIWHPIRNWLEKIEVDSPSLARFLYRLIPGQCPFERDVVLLGRTLFHIPPLCKLNPLYEQLVGLRFKSLCYLVEVCGEAI